MRFLCIFLAFILHLPHVYWSCDHLTYVVLIIGYIYIYIYVCVCVCVDVCYSPIFPCVFFFSFFIHIFLI